MKFLMNLSKAAALKHILATIVVEKDDIVDTSIPLLISLPTEVDGVKVLNIGNNNNNSSIIFDTDIPYSVLKTLSIELVIPEGVTEINERAFAADKHLQKVTIPASLTVIGENAFKNCKKLKKVVIPADSQLDSVCHSAFCNSGIESFDFPASIKYIGNRAFNSSSLQSVSFAEEGNELTILANAFDSCRLIAVKFPKKIKKIGNNAFSGITTMREVTFPEDCILTTIPKSCFSFCSRIITVTLGRKLKAIEDTAFSFCPSLQEINLQDTKVKELGNNCFSESYDLMHITLPKTLTSLGFQCFAGSAIEKIDLSYVQSMGSRCFSESNLKEVIIPVLESYEESLFANCQALESVSFTGVEKVDKMVLGENMFSSTFALKEFAFPEKVTEISKCSFFHSGIKNVDLSNTKVKSIHELAFASTKIDSISFPSTLVGYMAKNAFKDSEYPKKAVEAAVVFMV